MVIRRMLRHIPRELRHLDFCSGEVALASGPQNLSLTGFLSIHHVWNPAFIRLVRIVNKLVIHETRKRHIRATCGHIQDTVAVIGSQPRFAIVGTVLAKRAVNALICCVIP